MLKTLKAGFLLLAQELNCIQLTVPGVSSSEYETLVHEMKS